MVSWQNGKLAKWQVDEMAICQDGKLTKGKLDEMANWNWRNSILMNWQVYKRASWSNFEKQQLYKMARC